MTSDQLHDLLEKYLADTITEADFKQLWSTLDISEQDVDWYAAMDELLENHELHGLSDDVRTQSALLSIKARLANTSADGSLSSPAYSNRNVHRVHFLKTAWFRYAAILLLIAGTATFVYLNNLPQKDNLSEAWGDGEHQTDIQPGGEKAILTLSDGTTIGLDSAGNGTIAKQGNAQVIKLSNGQITYNLQGLAGKEEMWNTMTTPRGGQYRLSLPDGSKVWLNAASSIRYPVAFNGKERRVEVSGEAYFEITSRHKQPFVVNIDHRAQVEVLGTAFNVNAYQNEPGITTALIEGAVRVRSGKKVGEVLSPGQQAAIGKSIVVSNANIEGITAWKNGTFYFNHLSLAEIMRQIERWYDVEVVYEQGIPDIQLFGGVKRNLSLEGIISGLTDMGVNLRLEPGKKLVVAAQ